METNNKQTKDSQNKKGPQMRTTKADYIYRNSDDTIRVRILKKGALKWDFDIFTKDGSIETFSDCGDIFATKKEAKILAEYRFGKLISMGNIDTVTENWK